MNLPDNVSSTAITLAGNASGTFSIRAVALLTPEEMDEAVKMKVDFRATRSLEPAKFEFLTWSLELFLIRAATDE